MNSPVEVDYIESGTFQGGEEDVSTAGIQYDETCYVLRERNLRRIHNWLSALSGLLIGGGSLKPTDEVQLKELKSLIRLTTIPKP